MRARLTPGGPLVDVPNWRRELLAAVLVGVLARVLAAYGVDVGAARFAFLGFLIMAVVSAIEWLGQAAATVAITLAQAAAMIAIAVGHFAVAVAGVFVRVWGYLERFTANVVKPFVQWSWRELQRLHDWLARTVKPIVKALDTIRARVMAIWGKWFRPIFDTIDAFRQVLGILSALHVEWARDLDRRLAALEDRLLSPIRVVMARLNEVSNWINRIVDFDGYFQRLTLIASQIRYAGDTFAALHNARTRPLTADERAPFGGSVAAVPATETIAALDQAVRGDAWVLMTPSQRDALNAQAFGGPIP